MKSLKYSGLSEKQADNFELYKTISIEDKIVNSITNEIFTITDNTGDFIVLENENKILTLTIEEFVENYQWSNV